MGEANRDPANGHLAVATLAHADVARLSTLSRSPVIASPRSALRA